MNTEDRTDERASTEPAPVDHYEIRIAGRLSSRWATWFGGLDLTDEDDGTTVIRGPVVDQAALHGLLQRLRDLGIPLLSLSRCAPGAPVGQPIPTTQPNPTDHPGATP